ncbi:hypothetical protein Q5P01_000624 [Channa striata]|uniref:Uncharacterized protein n=1 Tax=Channa striata TaxID=64152 RepID=A0AA88LMC7_CHASR|nr:hypothetical protein Q5P01_000624 [Channa striata]
MRVGTRLNWPAGRPGGESGAGGGPERPVLQEHDVQPGEGQGLCRSPEEERRNRDGRSGTWPGSGGRPCLPRGNKIADARRRRSRARGIRPTTHAPHAEFCAPPGRDRVRRDETLADGMKEKLFLVTGPSGVTESRRSSAGLTAPGFHFRYLDCRESRRTGHMPRGPSRSRGAEGVLDLTRNTAMVRSAGPGTLRLFVHFAEPTSERLATLRRGAEGAGSADTLLVELANALEGAVTVCTEIGLTRVLTASGREGLTLRLTTGAIARIGRCTTAFGSCSSRTPRAHRSSAPETRASRRSPEPQRRAARDAGCCPLARSCTRD